MTPDDSLPLSLFRFIRAHGTVEQLAPAVDMALARSPKQTHVVFERLSGPDNQQHDLCLLDVRTGKQQTLKRDCSPQSLWPCWQDNEHISLPPVHDDAPKPVRHGNGRYYEIVLYQVEGAKLAPVWTLSRDWPLEMKPVVRDPVLSKPTTRPATLPR